MTPNLPPDRELPPGRHAEIRDQLVRTVNGKAAKPMARWLVPATAAAAVIAVTSGAMALSGTDDTKEPSTGLHGGRRSTVAPAAPRAFPVIPGISRQRSLDIAYGCARSYGVADEDLPPRTLAEPNRTPKPKTPAPDSSETHIGSGSDLRLYNLVTDAAGTKALLYGSQLIFTCVVDPNSVTPYNAGGGELRELDWLPGEMAVDHSGADGLSAKAGEVEELAGRVTSKVAKVSATFNGVTVTATPRNGTFLLRRVYPVGWQDPYENDYSHQSVTNIRAYDANGAVINAAGGPPCYITPAGVILDGAERNANKNCKPAIPWR